MKASPSLKTRNLVAASLALALLAVSCGGGAGSSTKPPSSTSATVFHIVGDVDFIVDMPDIISASQLNSNSIVGACALRLKDGGYHLYLQSRDQVNNVDVLSLSSGDGVSWTPDPGIRIEHGSAPDLDVEAGEPDAYIGPDGKYYMAYTGRQPASGMLHKIIFAVSEDGLAWTKLGINYSDVYNQGNFAASADVFKTADQYVMYYTGGSNIIYATSADGLNWKRQKPVFRAGHDSTTVYMNGLYYMFAKIPHSLVYPLGGIPGEEDDLLMAISPDGVNWSSSLYRVTVKNADGTDVANTDLGDPGAVIRGDASLRIFLNNGGGRNIFSIKPASALPVLS